MKNTDTNTNIAAGTQVQAHTGTCVGFTIYEDFYKGEILKVNEKSIRVKLTNIKHTENGKTKYDNPTAVNATFTFWKIGADSGKALYKNSLYGTVAL